MKKIVIGCFTACIIAHLFACAPKNRRTDVEESDTVRLQQYQDGQKIYTQDTPYDVPYIPGADTVDYEPTLDNYNKLLSELADSLKATDPEEVRLMLEEAIDGMKQIMPADAGYGLIYNDVEMTDKAVIYHLLCDENYWNMDEVEKKKEELGEEFMMADAEDPQNAILAAMCKAIHCNVEFYLTGNQSGKTTHIVMTF